MRQAVLALVLAAAGCAARTPVAATPAPFDDLTPLVAHGCYRCLEQAYDMAQARGVRATAFEAAALLVLRAKELGLSFEPWLERARSVSTNEAFQTLVLAIVEAAPVDPLADREALLNVGSRARARAAAAGWRQELQAVAGSALLRAYLDIALLCSSQEGPERDAALAAGSWPETPLTQYRLGTCSSNQRATLAALREGDAAFVDADLALGRYALEGGAEADTDEALLRFRSASSAFPASALIATALGLLHQTREEWPEALAAFDAALTASPRHVDASLGRTVVLSNLGRRDQAIAAATQLIDAGQWFVGEALYWRAWNLLQLNRAADARADADRARTMVANAQMFVLSGLIDWRLRRLESAEEEFQRALAMDFGECEAARYMGVVRAERARLPEAIAALNQARQCYDLSLTLRREALEKIAGGPAGADAKARAAAREERAIKDIEGRRDEAARSLQTIEQAVAVKPVAP